MLEPDWLIGQYKREVGIVNEAGILQLACGAEVEQKDSKCSTRLQCFQFGGWRARNIHV